MSERWDEAADELREERARRRASGEELPALDERAEMEAFPLIPPRAPVETRAGLDLLLGGKPGPWTRLTCDVGGSRHDTGAELRIQRSETAGWLIVVRKGAKYRAPTAVVPQDDAADTNAPGRWELVCAGCGRPARRSPEFLDAAMLDALREHLQMKAGGRATPPRISWTATSTTRSRM